MKSNYRNRSVSEYLFHFTGLNVERKNFKTDEDSFNILLDILKERKLKYSRNTKSIVFQKEPKSSLENVEVAMICLTETPIQFLEIHMLAFNQFGIGLNRDWGVKNGAMNVIYYSNEHPNVLGTLFIGLLERYFNKEENQLDTEYYIDHTIAGITEDISKNPDLRDEREVRFIKDYKDKALDAGVGFESNDLKYIVVKKRYQDRLNDFLESDPYWKNNKNFDILNSEDITE